MQRTLFAAFASLLAVAATAGAQSLGTLYYKGGPDMYSVNGDGSGNALILNTSAWPSARADYPGGRRFLTREATGTIPGVGGNAGDLFLSDLGGNEVQLTDIAGPDYYTQQNGPSVWSNDGLDSFFSFWVVDAPRRRFLLYRAFVAPSDILSGGYIPLTIGDPRLQLVYVGGDASDATHAHCWNAAGTRFAHLQSYTYSGVLHSRIRLHAVGPDTSMSNDIIVNDSRLSGVQTTGGLDYSPVDDRILSDASKAAAKKDPGGRGFVVWTPGAAGWSCTWLQKETSTWSGLVNNPINPVFSPDGTGVAFNGRAYSNRAWLPGLFRCPSNGGPIVPVSLFPSNDTTIRFVRAWRW